MSSPDYFKLIFSMYLMQLPIMIVSLVACLLIARAKLAGRSSLWALLGFGLIFLICSTLPIFQLALQNLVFQGGQMAGRRWLMSAFSMAWTVLHAASYVFLLLAILSGRPPSTVNNRPGPTTPD